MSLPSPTDAKVRVASAAAGHPERLPDARRDLAEANLRAAAKRIVDRAIATGASPPTEQLLPALRDILGRWTGGDE